jgi:GT2 family glycosyltransferase
VSQPSGERVAIVVVTHDRADLLRGLLDSLAAQTRPADAVFVVDNASTDHTCRVLDAELVAARPSLPLHVVRNEENLGGAGGFHLGMRLAYDAGHDRILLLDDDVAPAPDCLATLLAHPGDCLMAVREDSKGQLVERAATRFDLRNPLAIRPKRAMVSTSYPTRESMPALVELENVAFEGFMVRRAVVDRIGLPDPSYFIFYDDVDYAVRARRAGFRIWAVRDAVVVRRLDFDQQHDLDGWKGYYMYRNLFAVHLRYGENALVRLKPWLITAAVVVLSPLRGGRSESRNALRGLWGSRRMRIPPGREPRLPAGS